MEQKFKTGEIVTTCGVYDLMDMEPEFRDFVLHSFARHFMCDWGEIAPKDKRRNDEAVLNGDRILSAYNYPDHEDWKIWIITEWDRSATTILFPHEY